MEIFYFEWLQKKKSKKVTDFKNGLIFYANGIVSLMYI